MCGRYATSHTSVDLTSQFEVGLVSLDAELEADYNVAPTKMAPLCSDVAPTGRPTMRPPSVS